MPRAVYECDVEIVASCIVETKGWRVALTVKGCDCDCEYEGELAEFAKQFHYGTRGTGGMTHNDVDSRPAGVYGRSVTLCTGDANRAYLLRPIIPAKCSARLCPSDDVFLTERVVIFSVKGNRYRLQVQLAYNTGLVKFQIRALRAL
jgi:hypothetical protein